MQNELSVRIFKWFSVFSCLSATAMAASFALLIVCRFGCDLMSMCVMEFVLGFTTPAPNVGFPLTCEPSVYMKSSGFHLRLCCVVWSIVMLGRCWVGVGVLVYDFLLSMCVASIRVVSILCVWVLCP
jgi:hypothetical protein